MKRILIISDYFPPIGSVASLRSAYLSVKLKKQGWDVHVICQAVNETHFIDNSITALPPNENIHRLKLEKINQNNLRSKFINLYQKIFLPALYRNKTELYSSYFNESKKLLSLYKFNCIYCSSGPEVTILIGHKLKQIFNIPWIADFRDVPEMYQFSRVTDRIYKYSLIRNQNKLLQNADLIITVSEPLAEKLRKRTKKDIEVVLNGYDSNMHSSIDYPSNFKKFNIVYTGRFYDLKHRNPQYLFQSIDELIQSNKIDSNKISIDFFGTEKDQLKELSTRYLCKNIINLHEQCSLFDSLVYQHNACVLLFLSVRNQKGIYSTKIFDYLASKRPILSIPDDEDVIHNTILETNSGFCASTVNEIKDIIYKWYCEWEKNFDIKLEINKEKIESFSREVQSTKLVDLIDTKIIGNFHS